MRQMIQTAHGDPLHGQGTTWGDATIEHEASLDVVHDEVRHAYHVEHRDEPESRASNSRVRTRDG
jgi:hypothetical protein